MKYSPAAPNAGAARRKSPWTSRAWAIMQKEIIHIRRDKGALFFTLFIPVLQLLMLGYAVDTNVRHTPTVVFDQCRTQESRALIRRFESTTDFDVLREVNSDAELEACLVAATARVGIKIPEGYSRDLLGGRTAQVQLLVDGSESNVAAQANNVGNAIALRESLERLGTEAVLPVESRPRVLFNPDLKSPRFFIPGLIAILIQAMTVSLTSLSVVRELEKGTLEQLYMTPVRGWDLVIGKILPYAGLALFEMLAIIALMVFLFQVPIHGNFWTLVALFLPYIFCLLSVGLWISTRARTQAAALQMTFGTIIPSIFLSGYVFPRNTMPLFFRWLSCLVPATWMVDAARGVILRGAGWASLWVNGLVLTALCFGVMIVSVRRFRRTVG
ncbi:MAG: ABC transporter permease [Planctomycetes bacterium]|nr:ABC transporter permease [Planctomycetota bacterium]